MFGSMKKYSTTICFLLLALLLFSCASKTPWNPYLSMKVKPSEQQMRENNAILAKGNKNFLAQTKKNKKAYFNSSKKFFKMKKHYPHGKAKKQKKIRR
ncbi:MAG: hypothetical protein JWP12_2852 [Bacteroidetes bacterium]|nr:hypothetical protein [Bacteroidota bacterium]